LVGTVKGIQTVVTGVLENACEVLLITNDVTPVSLPDMLQAACLLIKRVCAVSNNNNNNNIIIIIIIIIKNNNNNGFSGI
jgi:hypothetical protein